MDCGDVVRHMESQKRVKGIFDAGLWLKSG